MNKQIIIIMMIILSVFLAGCGRVEFNTTYYDDCVEGKYDANDGFVRQAELMGGDIDYIEIYRSANGKMCYGDMVFKERLDTSLVKGLRYNAVSKKLI